METALKIRRLRLVEGKFISDGCAAVPPIANDGAQVPEGRPTAELPTRANHASGLNLGIMRRR